MAPNFNNQNAYGQAGDFEKLGRKEGIQYRKKFDLLAVLQIFRIQNSAVCLNCCSENH